MVTATADALLIETETDGNPAGIEYATWLALLNNPHNRKGLVKIELQRFHGRNGMLTFAKFDCSQENGHAIEAPGDMAHFEPDVMAAQLYEAAIRDGKRQGCDTYRVQLYRVKGSGKNRQVVAAEFAGLRFNVVTGEAVWGHEMGTSPVDQWKEIAEFLQTLIENTMSAQTGVLTASTATLLTAVQAGDALTERRMALADRMEGAVATPQEQNDRWRMGLNTLSHTVRELVRFQMWNKDGKAPPPPGPAFDAGATAANNNDDQSMQKDLRSFFDGLTVQQQGQIKVKMGPPNYEGMLEVLRGDLANFQRNFPLMGTMLGAAIHRGDLHEILTRDELVRLCKIFDEEPPAAPKA